LWRRWTWEKILILPGVKHEYTDEMMEELFRFFWEEALVTRPAGRRPGRARFDESGIINSREWAVVTSRSMFSSKLTFTCSLDDHVLKTKRGEAQPI
jgi:hypothetical protein